MARWPQWCGSPTHLQSAWNLQCSPFGPENEAGEATATLPIIVGLLPVADFVVPEGAGRV